MKKAFNFCHFDKPTACFCPQTKTKIGENSLPPRGAKELIENTAKSMSLYAALLLRVGVRGQQAFVPRHLERSERTQSAFTLAEVLITLAIIGVVAAISIPSVISNAQQQEFKTGLRKAVSVLNSAITMNIALDGETPYDNGDLFRYLQRHMSVMQSTKNLLWKYVIFHPKTGNSFSNSAFYTTDGMRFEFWAKGSGNASWSGHFLYEDNSIQACIGSTSSEFASDGFTLCRCGSYGLTNNPNNTTSPPCIITVDVNGDRKPNPANTDCHHDSCAKPYFTSTPNGKKLTDVFSILITESAAIPYGTAAQRAMYQAQK